MTDPSREQLQRDIAQHRAELAQTAELLAQKLDVRTRASAKAQELRPLLIKVAAVTGGLVATVLVVKRVRR